MDRDAGGDSCGPCSTGDGRDTLLSPGDTAGMAKVLVYYSAEGCTPCKLKELMQWRPMIEELSEDSAVRFVFILNPAHTTERELDMTLYGMRFAHPVFYDRAGGFETLNPELPKDPVFHTFLLDRANRVLLVGSPVGNAKMWELYKRTAANLLTGKEIRETDSVPIDKNYEDEPKNDRDGSGNAAVLLLRRAG